MKKSFVVAVTGLIVALALAGPAQAGKGPVVYKQARAIPTKSGEQVRITIYTRYVKRVKIKVDGSAAKKGIRDGKGCGQLRCDKWKLYAQRDEDECYKLNVSGAGRQGQHFAVSPITTCEPFPEGSL